MLRGRKVGPPPELNKAALRLLHFALALECEGQNRILIFRLLKVRTYGETEEKMREEKNCVNRTLLVGPVRTPQHCN